nr:MAG TPA: hypothetical protein [Caudoviricetes sp.]
MCLSRKKAIKKEARQLLYIKILITRIIVLFLHKLLNISLIYSIIKLIILLLKVS